jgi:1-acyl-sn-glycerol-3-phosphate acyltransferase
MIDPGARSTGSPGSDANFLSRLGPTPEERTYGSAGLRSGQRLCRLFCRLLGEVQLVGLEFIPVRGPVVLAVNHRSFVDGPLVFGFVQRVVSSLVKDEAFRAMGGRAGRMLVAAGQIPVRRGQLDPAPVRLALRILADGGVVGVFPEGTRGAGFVLAARPGVGYLALRTGATVVPLAISGSAELIHRRSLRPQVLMRFGQPLTFPAPEPGMILRRAQWLAATEVVRAKLADLVAQTVATKGLSEPVRTVHQ